MPKRGRQRVYSPRFKAPRRKRRKYNPNIRTGGFVGKELKFLDTTISPTTVALTGTIIKDTVNSMIVGTGESQRIGRKVKATSLMIRGSFDYPSQPNLTTSLYIRLMVYQDTQTNGSAATITDILESANVDSFRNLENSKRFKILYETIEPVNAQCAARDASTERTNAKVKPFQIFIKFKRPMEFVYKGSGGGVSDLTQNNIGVLGIVNVAPTVAMSLSGKIRLRYMG